MKKFLIELKDSLMDINTSNYIQFSNYLILVVLAAFIKIFLISMNDGEMFVTGFEVSVWAFMMIWLILRAFHSFNILQGYFLLAGIPVLLYILVGTSNMYFIHISMIIVIIGRCFQIKELFASTRADE